MSPLKFASVFLLLGYWFQMLSCMPVMKMVYGLHKPGYVSDAAVLKYYNHLGLHDKIYRLKEYAELNRKKYHYIGNSMPDILVFNSKGELTKFALDCSGDFDSIAQLSIYDIDHMELAGKTFQDFIDNTYVINPGNDLGINMPVYVIKFAEYAGLLNKDNVPHLVEKLRQRTDVGYMVLNMDYTMRE